MKKNSKYIILFILLAFSISAPVHLGYFDEAFRELTFYSWIYLFAGFGPFVAGLFALYWQKQISNRITIFGVQKTKNLLIALLPIISFSIIGLENSLGINAKYFGFIYALINVIYAFLEEFGWRRYLQNALEGINKNWKYILIGIIWWLWHLRFETQFDLFIFPIICIFGGYLLGKLTDKTKTILPATMIHTLIIILTNSGPPTNKKIMGAVLVLICWMVIEQIWKRKKPVSTNFY